MFKQSLPKMAVDKYSSCTAHEVHGLQFIWVGVMPDIGEGSAWHDA